MQPTRSEIEDEWDAASCDACDGVDKYPAMSYAEGVAAALGWVLGNEVEPPYSYEE